MEYQTPDRRTFFWIREDEFSFDLTWDGKVWRWEEHPGLPAFRAAMPQGFSPLMAEVELFLYFLDLGADDGGARELMKAAGREDFLLRLDSGAVDEEVLRYAHDAHFTRELTENFHKFHHACKELAEQVVKQAERENSLRENIPRPTPGLSPPRPGNRPLQELFPERRLMLKDALEALQQRLRAHSGGNVQTLLARVQGWRSSVGGSGPLAPPRSFRDILRSRARVFQGLDTPRMRRLQQRAGR